MGLKCISLSLGDFVSTFLLILTFTKCTKNRCSLSFPARTRITLLHRAYLHFFHFQRLFFLFWYVHRRSKVTGQSPGLTNFDRVLLTLHIRLLLTFANICLILVYQLRHFEQRRNVFEVLENNCTGNFELSKGWNVLQRE